MAEGRRALDDRLLDALGEIEGEPFQGSMWRVVRVGRSALDGSRGAGRWNPASLSVLYGAEAPDGALAEMHYHLARGQSVFPSRMQHDLFELRIATKHTLVLADMEQLARLGIDERRYREMLYDRTREVGAAAAFMGFDGIIAPSARWDGRNIVLFIDAFDLDDSEIVGSERIDWNAWRAKHVTRRQWSPKAVPRQKATAAIGAGRASEAQASRPWRPLARPQSDGGAQPSAGRTGLPAASACWKSARGPKPAPPRRATVA